MNTNKTNRSLPKPRIIIEEGYRPKEKLDTSRPPKGSSAVHKTIAMHGKKD